MMKEAQKMALEMQRAQEELAEQHFEGSSAGGSVRVVVTGDQLVSQISIDPSVFDGEPDSDDVEMVADAVTLAVNEALGKARAAQQEALGPLAGGLGGMGLPGT